MLLLEAPKSVFVSSTFAVRLSIIRFLTFEARFAKFRSWEKNKFLLNEINGNKKI